MNRTSVEEWDQSNDRRHWLTVLVVLLVLGGCSSSADNERTDSLSDDSDAATIDTVESTQGSAQRTLEISSNTVGGTPATSTTVLESPTTSTSGVPPLVTFAPMFIGLVAEIDADLTERMSSSWRDGCPVTLSDLRYLTLSHWNFDGQPVEGELVVNASVAADVVNVFQKMFAAEFPIQEMRLVAEYGADDDLSMAANNTSAFNCRFVAGTQSWSKHAFGLAVDINPLVNPYVQGSKIDPPGGAEFADRSIDLLGSINASDVVVAAFADIGWSWGGAWTWPDYQHFSAP